MTDNSNHDDQPQKPKALPPFVKSLLGSEKKSSPDEQPLSEQPPKPKAPESTPIFESNLQPPLILPVVPIREGVLFPGTESVLTFGRKSSIAAIKQARYTKNLVVLVTQKDQDKEEPQPEDLYKIGTLAIVDRTLAADNQLNVLVRGVNRIEILEFVKLTPHLSARVQKIIDVAGKDDETKALLGHLQKIFRQAVNMGKPVEFLNFMKLMSGGSESDLIDQIASTLSLSTHQKQSLLETTDIKKRLKLVIDHLSKEIKVLEIEKDVASKTQEKFEKHMRENVLRERMKTIQKELGEIDDEEEVLNEYEDKLRKAKLDKETHEKVSREIKRLKQMSVSNPEAGYIRTWLDTVFELPWGKYSKGNVDLIKAAQTLHKNHYGLEEVKDRILEYIAVLQLKQKSANSKERKVPTILCFVGPPGVGKTSIGRSIAEALGRKFVKISLGGIRDEAEIRGHRRTYVGAMPGRILGGLKQAGAMNPVFMLDEIDKIGTDFRGDPSAALLEALDPEQNQHFEDHYLDMQFDLSNIIFITTANVLETIPPALRDRLEIITYSGYTQEEKFHIAKDHLFKKQLQSNGLKPSQIDLNDEMLETIISRYTREAGVRSLEKTINKIMRKAARRLLETKGKAQNKIQVDINTLRKFLGPEEYDITSTEKTDPIGVSTGLAWTSVGGDVLFIEVALTSGKGQVKLTGKLGEVMQESAQAALTYVKAHATKLGISDKKLSTTDVHIHVPEGAVPKDGPSAGITIATAIVSAFTKRSVKRDVAMTGEITLRGRALRIGGLKEKSIAAHRAGAKTVIIPQENERDLVDIPDSVKEKVTFKPVENMDQVLAIALNP